MRLPAITRRQALGQAGRTGVAGALALRAAAVAAQDARRGRARPQPAATLKAAVARIVPASGSGDWSAADVGADNYILTLLSGTGSIYAGGPYRSRFASFQVLSRIKRLGWSREVKRLRSVYAQGLAQLDTLAGGNFATAPAAPGRDPDGARRLRLGLLRRALQPRAGGHLLARPVYGGNRDYRAWQASGTPATSTASDSRGIRPPDAPWNVYGGYAQEMIQPGKETVIRAPGSQRSPAP